MKILFKISTIFCFFIVFSAFPLLSQYNNDWISFDKTYYKYFVEETGIHRIPYTQLSQTDLPLHSDSLRLFYKGEQVPIYVSTEGVLQAGDYIEFYGEKNDGEFDTQLYDTPADQLQDKSSLFFKKGTYFLVDDISVAPLRYETMTNDVSNVPPAEAYFAYTSTNVIDQSFHFGESFVSSGMLLEPGDEPWTAFQFHSTYDMGEGYCSSLIKELINPITGTNVGTPFKVKTEALYEDPSLNALLKTRVVGRNKSTGVMHDK